MVDVQCEIPATNAGMGPKPVQCSGAKPGDLHPAEPQRERFSVPGMSAGMGGWTTLQALFTNNFSYKDFAFVLKYICFLVWFFKYTAR